jgi:hypothetical protein
MTGNPEVSCCKQAISPTITQQEGYWCNCDFSPIDNNLHDRIFSLSPLYPATAVGLGGGGCFFVCSTIEVGVDAGRVLNDVRDAVGSAVEKVLTQPVRQ